MAVFLQTDAIPGDANWSSEQPSAESELLVVEIDGVGDVIAPEIDPEGPTSICYLCTPTVTGVFAILPPISSGLAVVWRISIAPDDFANAVDIEISPDGDDTFINIAGTVDLEAGGENSPGNNPQSCTFVHDRESVWCAFLGGGVTVA